MGCGRYGRRAAFAGWMAALGMSAGCAGEPAGPVEAWTEVLGAESALEADAASAGLELCPIPGTLGEHLSHLQGTHFDYDPAGLAVDRIEGHYKPNNNGYLGWEEEHHADSYVDATEVEGSLTPGVDGPVAHYQITTTEDGGAVSTTEVEETWQGCQLTRRTRPAGGADQDWLTQQGLWDGQVYAYTQERISRTHGGRILLGGARQADGSWVEHHEGRLGWSDVYETWSGDADGATHVAWERNWGDSYVWGTDDRARDGTFHRYIREVWEWCVPWVDFTVGHDGAGTGSSRICEIVLVEYEGEWWEDVVYVPCTIAIAGGSCTQTCQNGAVSSCDHLL